MNLKSMNRLTVSEWNIDRTECEDLRWALKAEVHELREVGECLLINSDLSHINIEAKAVEKAMMGKYQK